MLIKGRIVAPDRTYRGVMVVKNSTIADVGSEKDLSEYEYGPLTYDFGEHLILPGFIDIHTHGIMQFSVFDTVELIKAAKMKVKFGTTGFLPTVASLSEERYLEFGNNVREAQMQNKSGARILGLDAELGSIETGKSADITVLDNDYNCVAAFIKGEKIYGS